MENEHIIIIALLLVILLVHLNRSRPSCPCGRSQLQGFLPEHIRKREDGPQNIITAGHIRSRQQDENPGALGIVNKESPVSHIRKRECSGQGFCIDNQRIQNKDHSMYHSQFIRHHLKNDHRQKMLQNLVGGCEGPDCAGQPF